MFKFRVSLVYIIRINKYLKEEKKENESWDKLSVECIKSFSLWDIWDCGSFVGEGINFFFYEWLCF